LKEADALRKAIGKKKADLMEKVKKAFLEGAASQGIITKEIAEELFSWIEKSNRYAFNKCLSPKTIVITENGEKCLDELNIGDKVLAPKNLNEDEFVEVIDIIDNGIKEVVEITMEDGKKIICTLDHKFLCSDGKVHKLIEILEQNLEIMCID
jgi:intein/homing endonuclease